MTPNSWRCRHAERRQIFVTQSIFSYKYSLQKSLLEVNDTHTFVEEMLNNCRGFRRVKLHFLDLRLSMYVGTVLLSLMSPPNFSPCFLPVITLFISKPICQSSIVCLKPRGSLLVPAAECSVTSERQMNSLVVMFRPASLLSYARGIINAYEAISSREDKMTQSTAHKWLLFYIFWQLM